MCLWRKKIKFKKNSIFLFGISSFDLQISFFIVFVFANEESDSGLSKICWFCLVGRALHWYTVHVYLRCRRFTSHLELNFFQDIILQLWCVYLRWSIMSSYHFPSVEIDDLWYVHLQVFFTIYIVMYGCISNTQCDQLSVCLIATLREHFSGIAEAMGLNHEVQAWIFLWALISQLLKLCV